jgi:hypothetical protein
MKLTLPVLLTITALPVACASAPPPFRPAVEAHLSAIATRNMDALLPTITSGDDLQMIAPDGFRYTTRQQYVDFHRQWFAANDNGRLDPEIIHLAQSSTLGHALIRYRYQSAGPDGKPHDVVSWLTLTFALESRRWRLVFDQNTLIQPPSPPAAK